VRLFRRAFTLVNQNRDLLNVGAYKSGTDPELDRALACYAHFESFLRQDMHEAVSLEVSIGQLAAVIAEMIESTPQDS
jgi:flagellum-specific ATP synthase